MTDGCSSAPLPGHPVRGSRSGRPVMVLLDLLGRRWTLRVLWELRGDPLSSRALRAACGISPSVLQTRLDELRDTGIVQLSEEGGYSLTEAGRELLDRLLPLVAWADGWAALLEGRPG